MTHHLLPHRLQRPLPDADVMRLLFQLSPARYFTGPPTVARLRRAWQLCVKAFATRERVGEVSEYEVISDAGHSFLVRTYVPASLMGRTERPALLWLHGGGFVFGDLYTAGATARKLANSCNCVVVTVDYRLAPEASIRDGLADCLEAFRWMVDCGEELGIDPKRIAVGGDSAGGTLAALVVQRISQSRGIRPCAQLLVYPAARIETHYADSQLAPMTDRMLAELFRWLQTEISSDDLDDPELSPGGTPLRSALPPAILITTGFDPLRDEALAYARKMADAGTPVQLLHFPGQFHGFLSFDAVVSGAAEAFKIAGGELSNLFAGSRATAGTRIIDPGFIPSASWLWLNPLQRMRELSVTWLMMRDAISGAVMRGQR